MRSWTYCAGVTPLGRRRGSRLRFRDPYFMYYYGDVARLQSLVEAGEEEEARRLAKRKLDTYAARVFEDWIWESLPELSMLLGLRVAEAGPWWHRGEEIDPVARSPGEEAAFMEAKWDALSLREAKAVLKRLEAKAGKTGRMDRRNLYIVVAREIVDADDPVTRLDRARILVSSGLSLLSFAPKPHAEHGLHLLRGYGAAAEQPGRPHAEIHNGARHAARHRARVHHYVNAAVELP